MAATGIIAEAVSGTGAKLTALGVPWTADPRNARPRSVLIELPAFDSFNYTVGDIRLQLRILAAPPSNTDATDYLITTADTIMASQGMAVTAGRPGYVTISGQDLPTYDLTVAVAVQRN